MSIYIDIEKLKNSGKFAIDEDHDWGYQIRMVNEDEYCGKFLVITNHKPGSKHKHPEKKETFIVLYGMVDVIVDGIGILYRPGDMITLEPGKAHQMLSYDPPVVILEVSTHDDDDDTVPVEGGLFIDK